MARYVLPGSHPGLLVRGTIDIDARLRVHVRNPNGSISSVRSVSFGYWTTDDTGRVQVPRQVRQRLEAQARAQGRKHATFEILAPSVIMQGGRWAVVGDGAARTHMLQTGQHLGVFDTPAHATAYGNRLHLQQAAGIKVRR